MLLFMVYMAAISAVLLVNIGWMLFRYRSRRIPESVGLIIALGLALLLGYTFLGPVTLECTDNKEVREVAAYRSGLFFSEDEECKDKFGFGWEQLRKENPGVD